MWAPVVQAVSLSTLIQNSDSALYVLGLFYLLSFLYALRRGYLLRGQRWDVQRIFVTAVGVSCGVRALSFALCTLFALDVTTSAASGWLSDSRLLLVLFNTGDWVAIVTYALLLLVWLKALLRTRTTVFSAVRIQRDWQVVIWVLVALLAAAQVGLYVAVFAAGPANAPELTDAIFATVAAFNAGLPLLAAVGGALELALFAGFPFRSPEHRAAWRRVSWLLAAWTLGRVGWAVCSLLLVNPSAPAAVQRVGPWLFPMLMVSVFVLAELIPFLMCLGTEVLHAFLVVSSRSGSAGGGGSGSGGGRGGGWDGGDGGDATPRSDAPLLSGALNGIPEVDEGEEGV